MGFNTSQAHPQRSATPIDLPWLQLKGAHITAETPFSEAADLWLNSLSGTEDIGLGKLRRVRNTTEHSYRANIATLKLFFRSKPLGEIRLDHISRYEAARASGIEPFIRKRRPNKNVEAAPCPAGPKKINQEITVLKRILRIAKIWGEEQEQCYRPLTEPESDVQRALSLEQQRHWLQVARSSPRWHLVYFYSELAFATCMSTNEIRSLRLSDIHLEAGRINVPWHGSKNLHRHRPIEIGQAGDLSWHAVEWLLSRAASLGAKQPHHHLFPFRGKNGPFDPTRPMTVSGLKRWWNEVRLATDLKWFRQYDTRHTAITRYAENGTPLSVIMEMAGHISPAMTRHYTHISDQQKLRAMRQVQAHQRRGNSEGGFGAPPAAMAVPASQASIATPAENPMQKLIQAEIARQVALALGSLGLPSTIGPQQNGAQL